MTPKQVEQFNRMHDALTTIAKKYQTAGQLRRSANAYCGLSFEEVMIGAYENIKSDAAYAVRSVRRIASNTLMDGPTPPQPGIDGAMRPQQGEEK